MRWFFLLCFIPAVASGQTDTTAFLYKSSAYDVMNHQRKAMYVLGGWSTLSTGVGLYQLSSTSNFVRGMGVQNLAWGLIDGAIAGYALYDLKRKEGKPIDLKLEQEKFRKVLLINTLLDVLYIGTGALMMQHGNAKWRGHGQGIIIQGSFLFLFDGVNYALTF